jgi:hypothetical protein
LAGPVPGTQWRLSGVIKTGVPIDVAMATPALAVSSSPTKSHEKNFIDAILS